MASYGAMLAILAVLGGLLSLPGWYYAGLATAAALVAYQWRLIRSRKREDCFRAFLHSNWVGAAVFAGIVLCFPLQLTTP
jgi:4-hydroxybenzoate polyprenyltransferase